MELGSEKRLKSGNTMPIIGLGTWQLTKDTEDVVLLALELGYRLIDTSSDYGTHAGIGRALKKTHVARNEIFLVTKVEEDDNGFEAVKDYLDELDQEYADLVLIHRPPKSGAGEKLWEDLIRAKKEGLTKDIGVSSYPKILIQKLFEKTGVVPAVNQVEWSPFGHSEALDEYSGKSGIIIQAWSPLTRGKKLENKFLGNIAEKYKKTPAQIILRWNIERGSVPIPKASTKKHLEENINIFDFRIHKTDIDLLNSLNENFSSLGKLTYLEGGEKDE